MSYSCLEELQVDLDLYALNKTSVLSKVGSKYEDGWFIITDDGICYLFNKDGNLDDIKKVTQLKEKYIREDIKKIIIPGSVTSIGSYAFDGCEDLTSVTIPDSVTSIGSWAFAYCSSLINLTFKGKTREKVQSMKNYPFGIKDQSVMQIE